MLWPRRQLAELLGLQFDRRQVILVGRSFADFSLEYKIAKCSCTHLRSVRLVVRRHRNCPAAGLLLAEVHRTSAGPVEGSHPVERPMRIEVSI